MATGSGSGCCCGSGSGCCSRSGSSAATATAIGSVAAPVIATSTDGAALVIATATGGADPVTWSASASDGGGASVSGSVAAVTEIDGGLATWGSANDHGPAAGSATGACAAASVTAGGPDHGWRGLLLAPPRQP